MRSALFNFSWVELNNADLDIADQNGEVPGVRGVRGVRVIHLAQNGGVSSTIHGVLPGKNSSLSETDINFSREEQN